MSLKMRRNFTFSVGDQAGYSSGADWTDLGRLVVSRGTLKELITLSLP